jgi:hypothetical protein
LLSGTEEGENEERGKEEEQTVRTASISAKLVMSPPEYKSTVLPLYQPPTEDTVICGGFMYFFVSSKHMKILHNKHSADINFSNSLVNSFMCHGGIQKEQKYSFTHSKFQ